MLQQTQVAIFWGVCYHVGSRFWSDYNRANFTNKIGSSYHFGSSFWFEYHRAIIAKSFGGFCYHFGSKLWSEYNIDNFAKSFGVFYHFVSRFWFDYYIDTHYNHYFWKYSVIYTGRSRKASYSARPLHQPLSKIIGA